MWATQRAIDATAASQPHPRYAFTFSLLRVSADWDDDRLRAGPAKTSIPGVRTAARRTEGREAAGCWPAAFVLSFFLWLVSAGSQMSQQHAEEQDASAEQILQYETKGSRLRSGHTASGKRPGPSLANEVACTDVSCFIRCLPVRWVVSLGMG